MKPEQLLDAMEHISQDYIAEAKPKHELHQESRVEQQARSAAETVTPQPTQQKSQRSGKDITMSNHSFGQRIMTGVIAAAACAVFVGGGIFIAMQAKQNRPDTANSGNENSEIKEITDRNFLGGEGEIHVMHDMETMYDDTNFYFSRGFYVAPRSSESLTEMREVSEKQKDYLSHVFSDGEQFYFADRDVLYRMDSHGKREDTPFFTASAYTEWEASGFSDINRLNNDTYVIRFLDASGDAVNVHSCRFDAAAKKADMLPGDPVPLDFYQESDDSLLYRSADSGDIVRYTFSTGEAETVFTDNHEMIYASWTVRNNQLYLIAAKTEDPENGNLNSYGKIDLATGAYTEINANPDFNGFITDGDKLFTVVNADTQLVCTDPEWTAPETLYDFGTAEIPERFRGEMQFRMPCCADENYIYLRADANADLDRELLFDRKTGKMLYFYLPVSDQSAQETDGSNLFGGTGAIRLVTDVRSSFTWMLRDDQYYYIHLAVSDERSWFRYPLEGGQGTMIPSPLSDPPKNPELVSDGTNILNRSLQRIVGGEMYPSMDEICAKLSPNALKYKNNLACEGIWHIMDKYFMWIASEKYGIHVWLDSSGNILDIQEYDNSQHRIGGVFCDEEHEHMYHLTESEDSLTRSIELIPMPGMPEESYNSPDGYIESAIISGGKTLYQTLSSDYTHNELRMSDEDGSSILLADNNRIISFDVRDDKVCYVTETFTEPNATYRTYMIDLQTDAREPALLYTSENWQLTTISGFADSGNRAGYEIVLSNLPKSVVFLDPETYEIIRELRMPNASDDADNASDEVIKSRALDATNAFIDYITNKHEAAAENLSILDQYLLKDGSAYKDMHDIISDVFWNAAYTERIDREMSITNFSMDDENTCICDVHFDYQLIHEDGSAQDNSGNIRWTFVKDGDAWKASAYSLSPSDDANSTASAQQSKELTDVSGSNFHGKLLKIMDPSRVYLGVSGSFGETDEGKQVKGMAAEYGAYAAINAGGFEDPDGIGNGGTPLGIVFSQGEMLWGDLNGTYDLIGFDKDNVLHAGSMTGKQAVDLGIRDAVSYSPILIADGKPVLNEPESNDLRMPRTAIGQTADGTVLLLVIEGRQADSLGATNREIIDIMLENGAVTAANLTGGGCSHMICNNDMVTASPTMNGPRKLPDCWLVAPES